MTALIQTTDDHHQPHEQNLSYETERRIIWRGVTICVRLTTNCYSQPDLHHLEIQSVRPEREPLPITETGYRSHYFFSNDRMSLDEATDFVEDWIDRDAQTKAWISYVDESRQGALF